MSKKTNTEGKYKIYRPHGTMFFMRFGEKELCCDEINKDCISLKNVK